MAMAIARDWLMNCSMAIPSVRLVGNGNMTVADWLGVGDMSMTISAGAMVSA